MSLLVDLQLVPQRILEKVRAAVLQNREALRHGGIRSRVNQATKQRPQFTKVGATMRDYRVPVPVATGLPDPDQGLAWAYVLKRSGLTDFAPIYHSIYSADGLVRYENSNEQQYAQWAKRGPKTGLLPVVYEYVDRQDQVVPFYYQDPNSSDYVPQEVIRQYVEAQTAEGEPGYYAAIPIASAGNFRQLLYGFQVFPLGNGKLVVQYCAQKCIYTVSGAQDRFAYPSGNVLPDGQIIYSLSGDPVKIEPYRYHQVTTVEEVSHWAFLVGPDYVKEIPPSSELAELMGSNFGYAPGQYEYTTQELAQETDLYIKPPKNVSFDNLRFFNLKNYTAHGFENVSSGEFYGIWSDPGIYEVYKNKDQINADLVSAEAAGPNSEEYQQVYSYEYKDELMPTWAKRLRLVTTAHPEHKKTTAAFFMNHRAIEGNLLEGDNLELWRPVAKAPQPPRLEDEGFPQLILDDIAENALNLADMKTYMVLDWARPDYCSQQLIELLGFTEADLAPPTPTP